ncbi:macrophage mannose receptor 1-like isoform X2 [Danio aesculapii]|uniref:macrophage mannose receptor 1-like isoform X2 n=1 Tax=Danio aesculapii TaxID=1142201 RepID=UPI0024C0B3EF|nr:macrophage mannose receptor 1-like isoform X2 [Danio aesculapii]
MAQTLYFPLLLIALCSISECVQRQYHFINENKTWTEAQRYCRENYTDLATVHNMNDMIQLNKTVNVNNDGVWIGLQGTNDSKWHWSSGDPVLFLNWASGQPAGSDNCTVLNNGQWFVGACNIPWFFICYNNKLIVIQQNLSWSEALRYCRQNHVDLVSVQSVEMQRRVMNVVKLASTEAVWLGLHNYCSINTWLWVSGDMVCYQNWAPGNGSTPENCKLENRKGAVQSGEYQTWISLPESHRLNFICTNY